MISHDLTLTYALAPGWQAPYVTGLSQGLAVASTCNSCGRTAFPPQQTCACGSVKHSWTTLSGEAEIIHQTDGLDGQFALVHFDGADTASVARIDGFGPNETIGQITVSKDNLPKIALAPLSAKVLK